MTQRTELDALPGLLDLKCVVQETQAEATVHLNLDDIQIDILWVQSSFLFYLVWLLLFRVRTKKEPFLFFRIKNATGFKSKLATYSIHCLIASTTEILTVVTQPPTAVVTRDRLSPMT